MPTSKSAQKPGEATARNGVNVAALFATIEAVKGNPAIAKFNFRAANRWLGGEKNRSTIRQFSGALEEHRTAGPAFTADNGEAPVLLGEYQAPNPVEWLLHALIGCMTTTIAYHAASRGITVDAIDSELDGDIDLRGFLGLSGEVRKGYSAIRVRMRVKTEAEAATIKALTAMSPVFDTIARSVPVEVTVETY
jgi:uncharacterized OsmC-like protein